MFKKCPRCKEKCFAHEKACHECGLIFDRLNYTSNKTAKKLILKGNRKDTIRTSDWPYDAKKSTALLLCGFLGFTGAHNFYLGRFFKGAVSLFGLILSVIMVVLNDQIYGTTTWNVLWLLVVIPGCCVLIFWISDFLTILFERYKIPVAIDENLMNLKNKVLGEELEKIKSDGNKINKKTNKKNKNIINKNEKNDENIEKTIKKTKKINKKDAKKEIIISESTQSEMKNGE